MEKIKLEELSWEGLLDYLTYITKVRYAKHLRDLADRYDPEINDRKILKDDETTLFLLSELNSALDPGEYGKSPFIEKYILKNMYMKNPGDYNFEKDYDYPENEKFITGRLINFIENFDDLGYSESPELYDALKMSLLYEVSELSEGDDDETIG